MTKILHITTVPQSLSFIKGLIAHLKANGNEVEVLSSPGDMLERFGHEANVGFHMVEMPRRITPLRDAQAVFRIWRMLRRINPTIVHAHTPKGGLLGIVGAWLARVPVRIYHIHGFPLVTAVGYKRVLLRFSEMVSCFLADQVLCVSHSIREVALNERLCPPGKIKVLLNGSIGGVDADVFDPMLYDASIQEDVKSRYGIPVHQPVMGFVGRIVRDKGIIELVSAWDELRDEFPDIHLLIVGPFEDQDPIPKETERCLRNDPRIHLTGWISENLAPLYSIMTVFVLPTYREGFPVSPLEASAMAIPVVATQIPGCVDAVVDGVTGTLVPPRNPKALAESIRAYLNDPELRSHHGIAGRERVLRDFRPEALWQAIEQEYTRLVEKHRSTNGQARV